MLLADYRQVYDPVGVSLGLSSLFAVLPLLVLFVLLGGLRMRPGSRRSSRCWSRSSSPSASTPCRSATPSTAALWGAAFGFFPIMWIVINAIWVYNLTVETGHFDVLRRSFASISDDQRVQAIIIAFCFGALMEALAGFGTPVAISSVMLIALGFKPIKAATVALVANTAPVAFGALAVPIITLAGIPTLPVDDLGSMVGRQTPVLAVFVPLALVFIVDGARGLRQVWPPALLVRPRLRRLAVPRVQLLVGPAHRHRRRAGLRTGGAGVHPGLVGQEGYVEPTPTSRAVRGAQRPAVPARRRPAPGRAGRVAGGGEDADAVAVERARADAGRAVADTRPRCSGPTRRTSSSS